MFWKLPIPKLLTVNSNALPDSGYQIQSDPDAPHLELGLAGPQGPEPGGEPVLETFDTRRRRKVYELTPAARVAGKDKVAEAQVVATPGKRLRRKPPPSMSTAQR